ncbi:M48 family peptidase [Myxococcus stipitatus DSM 14675]|uniref:M48 family peptidase n=1 Tax=Myxococcus stipitatus (strain DSM 14675 / JCM 12634 / Mx s8) TaxID=1278073 RepID=L7UIU4_MYXSD|nr:M48 family metallopeptidase [Myxococcus stipitatus]AGC47825.1 M48 family peptidase [Myxococcus stipitatus DSM 14675]
MQRILSAVWSLALVMGVTAGCTQQRVQAEKALAKTFITDEQEEEIGKQVKQELEQKEKVKYVQDPAVVEYVRNLSAPIIRQATKDRPGVKWKINVIDDPKQVNAFATPGGYLYVYTGLILASDTEAELAGVMAHEAGHVVGRHSARAMVNQMGLQTVTQVALGQNPGAAAQVAAQLVGGGAMLAHSRSEESEADEYGARYSSGAGYDPRGLITFFEKLQAMQGQSPGIMKWLSTHPTNQDRIADLQRYISQKNLRGTNNSPGQLPAIKQKLGGR